MKQTFENKMMTEAQANIVNRFSHHKLDQAAVDSMKEIRVKCRSLALLIEDLVLDPREKATALTHLQEAMMHANAGIVSGFPIAE